MPKIICASVDCAYNGDNHTCTANRIMMSECHIMTVYDGRQLFWQCKQYEMSEQSKRLYEDFKRILKNDGIQSIES